MNKNLIYSSILFLLAFLVYGSSLHHPFFLDDELQIVNNQAIHNFDIASFFKGSTFSGGGQDIPIGVYYKPILSLTYALLWQISNEPFVFHVFQLFLAAANSVLFFLLLSFWIPRTVAFYGAAFFLVHPINSEVVLYIADMQDQLYIFFGLLGLVLMQRKKSLILVSFMMVFSSLSKETGLLFLIIISIYGFIFENNKKLKFIFAGVVPLLFYVLLRCTLFGINKITVPVIPIAGQDIFIRFLTFPASCFYYLKTFWWPREILLNQNWFISEPSFGNFYFPFFLIILFTGVLGFLILRSKVWKRPILIFFLMVLILNMGLHSNILIPLDATVADRWFYMGSISLIGFLTVVVSDVWRERDQLIFAAAIGLIFTLSVRTYLRSRDWKSNFDIAEEEVRKQPTDFVHTNTLGLEYLKRGDLESAERYLNISVKSSPNWWTNWNNLGVVEAQRGNLKKAEEYFARAINNGQYPLAVENYALILRRQNREADLRNFLKEALLIFPKNRKLLDLKETASGQ